MQEKEKIEEQIKNTIEYYLNKNLNNYKDENGKLLPKNVIHKMIRNEILK